LSRLCAIAIISPPERGEEEAAHALAPPNRVVFLSGELLFVSLVLVVALTKFLTPTLELVIEKAGAPRSFVGIVIAGLVLLPEVLASYRAARANRLQNRQSSGLTVTSILV
jgi:Ca2+:H+ antiporter